MVSTFCRAQASLSVAFWRLFEFIQLFELSKLFFERVLDEFFSHRPSGYSPFEASDICHVITAFCRTFCCTEYFGRCGRDVHCPVGLRVTSGLSSFSTGFFHGISSYGFPRYSSLRVLPRYFRIDRVSPGTYGFSPGTLWVLPCICVRGTVAH